MFRTGLGSPCERFLGSLTFSDPVSERKLLNPFSAPDLLARLEADPRTRGLLGDPEYRRLLETLRSDPGQLGASVRGSGGLGRGFGGAGSSLWGLGRG